MLGIGENTRLLQRYEILERASMHFIAGWAMKSHDWDTKVTLGRHMWQDAQGTDRLRRRLKELRSGALGVDNQTGLQEVVDYAARANDIGEFITGLYTVIKPALLDAYRQHLQSTDRILDDGTVDALMLNITALQEQHSWAEGWLSEQQSSIHSVSAYDQWSAAVTAKLAQAGGIDGSEASDGTSDVLIPERPPFKRPHESRIDGFIMKRDRDTPPLEENVERWREFVFRTFMNEIGAGDNVASIIFDAPPHAEWAFLYDIARHCWDEYRHSEMGRRHLIEMGCTPTNFALGTGTYEFRDQLSIVDRLGMLTFVDETDAFHYKHGNRKLFHSINDTASEAYVMYDICDETRHVANGHRWIEHLQQLTGDKRTREELLTDFRRLLQKRIEFIGTGNKN